jgi:serine phosphatase RsbU (regulator of sigma subunit)
MSPDPARILVVDDDPGVLRAVQRVLGPRYDVRATLRSTEAAPLAREFWPDLAICDVRMPGLDGFELLDLLRDARPGLDVILMTGSLTGQDAHLVRALRERVYYFILKPFERDVLLALVDRCLESRRLREQERRHMARVEHELAAARAFQRAMLPCEHQRFGRVTIEARCRPCHELAGDLFDFAERPDGRIAFIVADVCGHGVPAALLTGTVKSAFRAGVAAGTPPAAIATSIVRSLAAFAADRFVTAFCGLLEPRARTLDYVNAGHPAGVLLGDGAAPAPLASTAPLLSSVFPLDSWSDATLTVPVNGRLFLHTDGLSETRGRDGSFPLDRAIEVLGAAAPSTGIGAETSTLDEILDDLERFRGDRPADDDVTMMLLHVP